MSIITDWIRFSDSAPPNSDKLIDVDYGSYTKRGIRASQTRQPNQPTIHRWRYSVLNGTEIHCARINALGQWYEARLRYCHKLKDWAEV